MATVNVQVMLARRPKTGASAFGHIDVSAAGRTGLESMVQNMLGAIQGKKAVKYHPDDIADSDEVMKAPLANFDAHFQAQAPWSLERAVAEIRQSGLPATLGAADIRGGDWSFYLIRLLVNGNDIVIVRARKPSYGLDDGAKLITAFVGTELRPVKEPLITFDSRADAIIVGTSVYVTSPRVLERLLIDADAVKARAPQTAAAFAKDLGAPLTSKTSDAIQRVCSHNANIARRVERLVRDGSLAKVTASSLRAALPDAGLPEDTFGKTGSLQAVTDTHAATLIDLAADLYYQPRFEDAPRRVAAYRRLET